MYIHIGADVSIPAEWIIGIFDLDSATGAAPDTVRFLARAEQSNCVDMLTSDIPRSFIVTMDRVFLSAVSASTLRLRWQRGNEIKLAKDLIRD